MKKDHSEYKIKLESFWPDLRDIWLMDYTFWLPTYSDLDDALFNIKSFRDTAKYALEGQGVVVPTGFEDQIRDCDNHALHLWADMSRYIYHVAVIKNIPQDQLLPWAFGMVLLYKVNGKDFNHAINICWTRDRGLVLIEPQDFTKWAADPEQDRPYFTIAG